MKILAFIAFVYAAGKCLINTGNRDLTDPKCFIKSYIAGQEYIFSNAIDKSTNETYTSIEKFAKDLGPSWMGHKLHCSDEKESHTIINYFNNTLEIEPVKPKVDHLEKRGILTVKNNNTMVPILENTKNDPTCLPLVSKHPGANPYHPLLTPPNSASRLVKAFPIIFYETARDCTTQTTDCRQNLDNSTTLSTSQSYSITDGLTNTLANTFGNTTTVGKSTSVMNEVSNMIDVSYSFMNIAEQGGSKSLSIADSLTKTHELQAGNSKTLGSQRDVTDAKTSDISGQQSWNSEISKSHTEDQRNEFNAEFGVSNTQSITRGAETEANVPFIGAAKISVSATLSSTQHANFGTSHSSGSSDTTTDTQGRGGFIGYSDSTSLSILLGHSESDTTDTRVSDSLSDAITNTNTIDTHYSNSRSDTTGNSKSHTIGSTDSYSSEKNYAKEQSQTKSLATTLDVQNSKSTESTYTRSVTNVFDVPVGTYGVAALLLVTKSTQIPFLCLVDGKEIMMTAEVASLTKNVLENSILATLDYSNPEKAKQYFKVIDPALLGKSDINSPHPDGANSIPDSYHYIVPHGIGENFESVVLNSYNPNPKLQSNYQLVIEQTGNMKIRSNNNNDNILWQTHTSIERKNDVVDPSSSEKVVVSGSKTRLRITKFGHILLEAEDLFTSQPYSPFNQTFVPIGKKQNVTTTYTTIWSNVPKHMRYRVGLYKSSGSFGYNLILEEFPGVGGTNGVDLKLYDAGGSVVWCALSCNSPVPLGFRFPDNFLFPTDFPTDIKDSSYVENQQNVNYVDSTTHNTLDLSIKYVDGNSFASENQQCGPIIVSGQGIKSPNGRFKLILQNSGNLVLKDGIRTMWESMTADVWFSKPPYSMRLSSRGVIYVTDNWHKLIFSTTYPSFDNTQIPNMQPKNTNFTLENSGEFLIRDSFNSSIYMNYFSFPDYNLFAQPFFTCYAKNRFGSCTTCPPMRPSLINTLWSNGTDYSPYPVMFNHTESLCSPSGERCVTFANRTTLGITGPKNAFYSVQEISETPIDLSLAFDLDGRLQVYSTNTTILLWNNTNFISGVGPFTSSITNGGRWSVFDYAGNEIWKFLGVQKVPLGEICSALGDPCSSGSCCYDPKLKAKTCQISCPLVEDNEFCNGISDSCKEESSCCFGKSDLNSKCRPSSLCLASNIFDVNRPGACVVEKQSTFSLGVCDKSTFSMIDSKLVLVRDPSNCVSGKPDGTQMQVVPCTEAGLFSFNKKNDFRLRSYYDDTLILDNSGVLDGKVFISDVLSDQSQQFSFSIQDVKRNFTFNHIYDINQPGLCITVAESNLVGGFCDDSKFSLVEMKLIYNKDITKCISGNKGKTDLSLIPCSDASLFTFDKFGENAIRLNSDETYIIENSGFGGPIQLVHGSSKPTDKQQFSFDVSEIKHKTFSNIYDINVAGVCLSVFNSTIIADSCDENKFALIADHLVYSQNVTTCISGIKEKEPMELIPCAIAASFSYNKLNDSSIRLKSDDTYIVENFGLGKQAKLYHGSSAPSVSKKQQFSFNVQDIKKENFSNIYDINFPGACLSVTNSTIITNSCDDNKFALIGTQLVYNKNHTLCVSGDVEPKSLQLVNCDQAGAFIYNKFNDYSLRLISDDTYVMDDQGLKGKQTVMKKGDSSATNNSHQQFSFNIQDIKYSNIYDTNKPGRCISVLDSDIVFGFCDDNKFTFVGQDGTGLLVYSKNFTKCIGGTPSGLPNALKSPLKLVQCSNATTFTYNKHNDRAFRLSSDDTWRIDDLVSGVNVAPIFYWRSKNITANENQQFSFDSKDVKQNGFLNIYNMNKPSICITAFNSTIINGFCDDHKFAFVGKGGNGVLVYNQNQTQCIGVSDDNKTDLMIVACSQAVVFSYNKFNDNAFRIAVNDQWRIDDKGGLISTAISLVNSDVLPPNQNEQFSFNVLDAKSPLFTNIYNINRVGHCLSVRTIAPVESDSREEQSQTTSTSSTLDIHSSNSASKSAEILVDSWCDDNKFEFLEQNGVGYLVYSKNINTCVSYSFENSNFELVPCSEAVKFTHDQKGDKALRLADYEECSIDDIEGFGDEVVLVCDPSTAIQFSTDPKDVKMSSFTNIYDIHRPGVCITIGSSGLIMGFCDDNKFSFLTKNTLIPQPEPLVGTYDTGYLIYSKNITQCVTPGSTSSQLQLDLCSKKSVAFSYNKYNDTSFRLELDDTKVIDDYGEIGKMIYLYPTDFKATKNGQQHFSLDVKGVESVGFRNIFDINKPNICLGFKSSKLTMKFCDENDDKFLYYGGYLVYNKDSTLCLSANQSQIQLVSCIQAKPFSYNKYNDFAFRLLSDDALLIDDIGQFDYEVKMRVVDKSATTDSNSQFSLDSNYVKQSYGNIYDIHRIGACITVSGFGLVLGFCDDNKFAFVPKIVSPRPSPLNGQFTIGYLVYNKDNTKCVSGTLDANDRQLKLVPCSQNASAYSYNKFNDKSFRLELDDSKFIDDYGSFGQRVYLYGGDVANQQQQFSFDSNDVIRGEFFNIYNINKPMLCVIVSGTDLINGLCDDSKFQWRPFGPGGSGAGYLVYSKDISKCVGGTIDGTFDNKIRLVSCLDATLLVYNKNNDLTFRFAADDRWRMDDWSGGVGEAVKFYLETSPSPNQNQQFSLDSSQVKPVMFYNIFDIHKPGICLGESNGRITMQFCSPSNQFTFVGRVQDGGYLVWKSDTSKCIAKDLRVVSCSRAVLWTYDRYGDKAFRPMGEDNTLIDIYGQYFASDAYLATGNAPNQNQQFSFHPYEIQGGKFASIKDIHRSNTCIREDQGRLIHGNCNSRFFLMITMKNYNFYGYILVLEGNPSNPQCVYNDVHQLKVKLCAGIIDHMFFSYNKRSDSAFRNIDENALIDVSLDWGQNVYMYHGNGRPNGQQQFGLNYN